MNEQEILVTEQVAENVEQPTEDCQARSKNPQRV